MLDKRMKMCYNFIVGLIIISRSGGMADALASGASDRKVVWVQVPSPAPEIPRCKHSEGLFYFSLLTEHFRPNQRAETPDVQEIPGMIASIKAGTLNLYPVLFLHPSEFFTEWLKKHQKKDHIGCHI